MQKRTPKWDMISKERKRECLEKIIAFFHDERNEDIGLIAAENVLDFFMEDVAADIYSKGVIDSKQLIRERFEDLDVELDLLLNK